MTFRISALAALLLLTGCFRHGPMVGGPCSYDTAMFEATVTGTVDGWVTLAGPGGDTFDIPATAFDTIPPAGTTVRVGKDMITKGTCTPVMYKVVDVS